MTKVQYFIACITQFKTWQHFSSMVLSINKNNLKFYTMSKKLLTGVIVGAAVGAALGILFAPESGKDTRKKLARKGTDLGDTVREKANEFGEVLKEKFESIKSDAKDILEKGKAQREESSNFS
jgi:gas vesicle protein